jgi:cysteine synthase
MPAPASVERISDAIGRTPVVRLARAAGGADVRVKLETRSPTSGYADRVAAWLMTLVKPARGATLAMGGDGEVEAGVAHALREHHGRLRAFLPESASIEVRQSLKALGADLELTPHAEGVVGAMARAGQNNLPVLDAILQANQALAEELGRTIQADGGACGAIVVGGVQYFGLLPALEKLGVKAKVRVASLPSGRVVHRLAGLVTEEFAHEGMAVIVDDRFGWTWRERLAKEEGLLLSPAAAAIVGVAIEHAQQHPDGPVYAVATDTGERFFSLKDTFS